MDHNIWFRLRCVTSCANASNKMKPPAAGECDPGSNKMKPPASGEYEPSVEHSAGFETLSKIWSEINENDVEDSGLMMPCCNETNA